MKKTLQVLNKLLEGKILLDYASERFRQWTNS